MFDALGVMNCSLMSTYPPVLLRKLVQKSTLTSLSDKLLNFIKEKEMLFMLLASE